MTDKENFTKVNNNSILLSKIIELCNNGIAFEEICKKLSIDINIIVDLLKKFKNNTIKNNTNKQSNSSTKRKYSMVREAERKILKEKAKELRLKGLTFEKIGKELGVSDITAYYWLRNEPFEKDRKVIAKQKAIELRKRGLTLKNIGKEIGVSGSTISYWIKSQHYEIEQRTIKMNQLLKKQAIAIELRNKGLFFEDIGQKLGVTRSTIYNWLKSSPSEIERKRIRDQKFSKENKNKAIELRLKGFTLRSISQELGVSNVVVRNWVNFEDCKNEVKRIKQKKIEQRKKTVVELRKQGVPFSEIAKRFKVNRVTAQKWIMNQPFSDEIKQFEEKLLFDRKNTAIELRKKGFTFKAISKEIGVSDVTIIKWLKNEPFEIEMKKLKKDELLQKRKKAAELRKIGWTFNKIGKELGVNWVTVYCWLKNEPFEIEFRKSKTFNLICPYTNSCKEDIIWYN